MKRFVAAVTIVFALGWPVIGFTQATTITTACPTTFTCAFSAAETQSLVAGPGRAGSPAVYLGYIEFDASSNVTMTGQQDVNGTVKAIGTVTNKISSLSGSCAPGIDGQPAIITLSDKSELSFVIDSGGNELQFILTKDIGGSGTGNSVRVGVCRKQ